MYRCEYNLGQIIYIFFVHNAKLLTDNADDQLVFSAVNLNMLISANVSARK